MAASRGVGKGWLWGLKPPHWLLGEHFLGDILKDIGYSVKNVKNE